MHEVIGIIAGICFALSALPQALKSIKERHSDGIATGTIILWLTGEVCAILYTLHLWRETLPIFLNYFLNLLFVSVILYYKLKPYKCKVYELKRLDD